MIPYAVVQTAPAVEPVTLTEAKAHLRVDTDADDDLIEALITAARVWCENVSRRAFVTQTLDLTLDTWPPSTGLYLPRPPIQSVTSITYTDEDGDSDTVSSDDYLLDTASGRLALKAASSWPSVTLQRIGGVVVRYVAGYGLATAVPQTFKQAILLVVGEWYENRENATQGQVPRAIELNAMALLQTDRVWPVMS